jgi:hypothetical protein
MNFTAKQHLCFIFNSSWFISTILAVVLRGFLNFFHVTIRSEIRMITSFHTPSHSSYILPFDAIFRTVRVSPITNSTPQMENRMFYIHNCRSSHMGRAVCLLLMSTRKDASVVSLKWPTLHEAKIGVYRWRIPSSGMWRRVILVRSDAACVGC